MKTKQETFDTVASALLKQGVPSINNIGCLYRGPNNTKCAAGHLIPDNKYTDDMDEDDTTSANRNKNVKKVLIEEGYDPEFVKELQIIHDESVDDIDPVNSNWLEIWKKEMIKFAIDNGLSTKVFD